jgi:hypothetical protein
MTSHSEIARLRQSIQAEIEASRRAINGLAAVASHEAINKRMNRVGELHAQLATSVGQDKATAFVLKTEAQVYDQHDRQASKWYHEKPTLMQVRRDHNLQSSELADVAGVPLRIEYQAEIGALIDINDAEKLLRALYSLTGKRYALDNVSIQVKSEVAP